jgi:tRNA(fMet)-specific endonuclease VapC
MTLCLLDTNAYGRLLAGDRDVLAALGNSETVFMSVFVLGELHAGFAGGSRRRENEKRLQAFLRKDTVRILEASARTAEVFGQVKNNLRRAGAPIPINDVWLAAHAIQVGASLVTFDRHFAGVPGLMLWDGFPDEPPPGQGRSRSP